MNNVLCILRAGENKIENNDQPKKCREKRRKRKKKKRTLFCWLLELSSFTADLYSVSSDTDLSTLCVLEYRFNLTIRMKWICELKNLTSAITLFRSFSVPFSCNPPSRFLFLSIFLFASLLCRLISMNRVASLHRINILRWLKGD